MAKYLHSRLTNFKVSTISEVSIQDAYKQLIENEDRNKLIVDDIQNALTKRKNILVLTDRIDHLEYMHKELMVNTNNILCIHGQLTNKERQNLLENLNQ